MENLLKIIKAVKKFIAKEFLWVLVVLLLAFLLALITKWDIGILYKKGLLNNETLKVYFDNAGNIYINNDISFTEVEYFLILYAFYIAFIYFIRLVVNAIKTLKKE